MVVGVRGYGGAMPSEPAIHWPKLITLIAFFAIMGVIAYIAHWIVYDTWWGLWFVGVVAAAVLIPATVEEVRRRRRLRREFPADGE